MMPETIALKNGFDFNGYIVMYGDLFLYMMGADMQDVFTALIEPSNTAEIVYTQANGESITFAGYTKLIAVRDEGNALITAVLRKGVNGSV